MKRRAVLGGLGALAAAPKAFAADDEFGEWASFKQRFVQPDGRVVDTGNGGQSHSEGQGWAMLFAERFDDRAAFNSIHDWTERVLRRPSDRLHAWRCRPGPAQVVDDPNTATDGDLCIAWALIEAGARWNSTPLHDAGIALASDILRLLLRDHDGKQILLPGLIGFEVGSVVTINPSYYIFPAFPMLAQALPDPAWLEVVADGTALLGAGRFGHWGLPPDWLAIQAGGGLSPTHEPRFSYDAVRLPLYMSWAGLIQEPAVLAASRFWTDRKAAMPDWIDVSTGRISPYPAPVGMVAIAHLVSAACAGHGDLASLPHVAAASDYYSAALTLLARLAWHDLALSVS